MSLVGEHIAYKAPNFGQADTNSVHTRYTTLGQLFPSLGLGFLFWTWPSTSRREHRTELPALGPRLTTLKSMIALAGSLISLNLPRFLTPVSVLLLLLKLARY